MKYRQRRLKESTARIDGALLTVIEYVRDVPRMGWMVRCKDCKYSRINVGGEHAARGKGAKHMAIRRHTVVSWLEGKPETAEEHKPTNPPIADSSVPPF